MEAYRLHFFQLLQVKAFSYSSGDPLIHDACCGCSYASGEVRYKGNSGKGISGDSSKRAFGLRDITVRHTTMAE